MLLFFLLYAGNLIQSMGNPSAKHKFVIYFSPLCPACLSHFKNDKKTPKLLKENKIFIIYHPILIQTKEEEQIVLLAILYKNTKNINTFLGQLKKIMSLQDYWKDNTEDNAQALLKMIKKKYKNKIPQIDPSDKLRCVKLAALAIEFSLDNILAAINDPILMKNLKYTVDNPAGIHGEKIENKSIQNLPAFHDGNKLYQDPEEFSQVLGGFITE